jgi:acyl-CoA thioesterase
MHIFDESLALEPISDTRLRGELDREWWIYVGPNGGFLASLCLKALQHVVGDDAQPRTLTVSFPGRAVAGPVDFEVQLDKRGRTFSFASGRMYQEGKLLSTFLGAFSAARPGLSFVDEPMPDVKMPEDIAEMSPQGPRLEFTSKFEYRPASDALPFSSSERARGAAWIRFRNERGIDALQIPTVADALFPAVFVKLSVPVGTPTIDLTIHFRSTPPRDYDWLLGVFETKYAIEGFIEEDGWIWARDGTLIAQSRQLALLPDGGT